MKVAKVESKSSPSLMPIPANQLRIIKSVVVPYFIAIYMVDQETADPWRHLTPKDFNTLQELSLSLWRTTGTQNRRKCRDRKAGMLIRGLLSAASLQLIRIRGYE